MRIIDIESAASALYDGERLVALGSRQLCEAVRDGTIDEYIAQCEEERRKNKIGFHSARVHKQLAQEAMNHRPGEAQTEMFA